MSIENIQRIANIRRLIQDTEMTLQAIAEHLNCSYKQVRKVWETYPVQYRRARKSRCYRNSKFGDLNPMTGKCGELHPGYVGLVGDNKGYLMVLKPDWYTGRRGSKHVFVHSVVVCEHLGLTEIPAGWCVHHVDCNPYNNVFDNLVLMRQSDHTRLHAYIRQAGATTISKESTLKWVEAHGTPFKRDDIVCSA